MAIITKEKKRIACYESDFKGKMLPTVTTEATGMDKFCGTRRFTIEDSKGEKAVIADTQWLLMNRATQKMERINNFPEFDAYECFEKGVPLFKKIAKNSDYHLQKTFNVRFLDIDLNKHVNHVKYLAWAIEILPLEALKTMVLREAKIVYKAQGFYGDQVKAMGEIVDEGHYRVEIVNQEDTLLCQLELFLD